MSCKETWAKNVAGRLSGSAFVAPAGAPGADTCIHEWCKAKVNLATGKCIQGHFQYQEETPGYPPEMHGLMCACQELIQQDVLVEGDPRVQAAKRFVGVEARLLPDEEAFPQGENAMLGLVEVFIETGEWDEDPRIQAAQMALSITLVQAGGAPPAGLEDGDLARRKGMAAVAARFDPEIAHLLEQAGGGDLPSATDDGVPYIYITLNKNNLCSVCATECLEEELDWELSSYRVFDEPGVWTNCDECAYEIEGVSHPKGNEGSLSGQ